MKDTYEYDVAFSFAGEDREYVDKVASFLRKQNVRVFYDYFEEANLWGKNLIAYLEEIYTHSSKYCVVFISKFYCQKQWTCYESAIAMTRMLENNVKQIEYILPVKFDETKVPGILGTIGFVDGKKKTPEELGKLIINKISKKNDIQNSCVTVEEFKEYMIKLLTSDLPYYWAVSNNEFDSYIEFRYSFSNFDYFLKIIMEQDENTILVIGEYTDAFCDKHIFVPSAKICLDINDKTITNAKIINIDFFDSLELDISTPFEVIEQIKKQILKKGGE